MGQSPSQQTIWCIFERGSSGGSNFLWSFARICVLFCTKIINLQNCVQNYHMITITSFYSWAFATICAAHRGRKRWAPCHGITGMLVNPALVELNITLHCILSTQLLVTFCRKLLNVFLFLFFHLLVNSFSSLLVDCLLHSHTLQKLTLNFNT